MRSVTKKSKNLIAKGEALFYNINNMNNSDMQYIHPIKNHNNIIGYKVLYPIIEIGKKVHKIQKIFSSSDINKSLANARNFVAIKNKEYMEKNRLNTAINNITKSSVNKIVNLADIDDETVNADLSNVISASKELIQQKIDKEVQRKTAKRLNKLPKYVYPVFNKHLLVGYKVEGFSDNNNNPYPVKIFTDLSSNTKREMAAIRYLKYLEIKNKDAIFVEPIIPELANKGLGPSYKKTSGKNLPKYLAYVFDTNKNKIGYQINNFPSKDKPFKKKICSTEITMEEKYNQAIECLKSLWTNYEKDNKQI